MTDGAVKAEAMGTNLPDQPAGGATAAEEASTTLCSQGPTEGKGESTQASAWACCPRPHHLERDKCNLDGRSGAGGNQEPSIYLLELHPVVKGPSLLEGCSQLLSGEGLLTRELGTQTGTWKYCSPCSLPGWAPKRDLQWEIIGLTLRSAPSKA